MKQFIALLTLIFLFFFSTIHAQLTVKDQDTNPLLQINDEGIAGSITLPELPYILSSTENKLYHLAGALKWNGSTISTVGSTGWSDDGSIVRLSTPTDKVGIGTTNPLSKLSVGGDGKSLISIYGIETATGLVENYGGYFEAFGDRGRGVYGEASGIYGAGVYGNAKGEGKYGGYFKAERPSGYGVYGEATGTSGIGVYGIATNYAGYFNGRGCFIGNVGIGIENPSEKLIIKMGGLSWAEPHFALEASESTNKWDFTVGTSDRFYIGYNESSKMVINTDGDVGIGTTTPSRKLYVNGSAGGTETWNGTSDKRLKKNIRIIPNALEKVNNLRGVNFEWKDTGNHSKGVKMGFIAQEAKEIIPEVVSKSGEYYSMQYASITALLVEAVKEQNKEFRNQNVELKKRVEQLEEIVAGLINNRNNKKYTSVLN